RLPKAAKDRCGDRKKRTRQRSDRMVTYHPPPSTGTNYNLVGTVSVFPGDKVFWTIINAPEGRFVIDYRVKRGRRKRCPDCEELIPRSSKKCETCKAKVREARNKRYYENIRLRTNPS